MIERLTPGRLAEALQGKEAIPFFFIPQIGFLFGGDMKKLNECVGYAVNPFAVIFQDRLNEYNSLAARNSPHRAYHMMTGETRGHLGWVGRIARAAHIPDYHLLEFFEEYGIFGHDTPETYRFYVGRHPEKFTDEFLVKMAVENLHALGKEKAVTVIDCRSMVEARFDTLVDFLNNQDSVHYVNPVPIYTLDDRGSLMSLAYTLKTIVTNDGYQKVFCGLRKKASPPHQIRKRNY